MVSAILLAAGSSTRMGAQDKLFLKYKGHWLVNHVMQQLWAADIDELIIVRKDNSEHLLGGIFSDRIKLALNPIADKGMTTSIQAGVRASSSLATGYMICQADMPLTTTEEYNHILSHFNHSIKTNPKTMALPFFQNQKGNPIILSSYYKDAILAHEEMEGCRKIVQTHSSEILKVEMDCDHVLFDVDNEKDWQELLGRD